MKLENFRRQMDSLRTSIDEEARLLKESQMALVLLQDWYQGLDAEEQQLADQVLAEWALSEDETVRFDALALIDHFKIANAKSTLQVLAERLALSRTPGAPFELTKVQRILGELG